MRATLQPLGYLRQYFFPASRMMLAAFVSYGLLRAAVFSAPNFFHAHHHLHLIALFIAHTFGLFMLIVAALIVFLGVNGYRHARAILKPSPPNHS